MCFFAIIYSRFVDSSKRGPHDFDPQSKIVPARLPTLALVCTIAMKDYIALHRCNKPCFTFFIQVTFFTFFNVFLNFFHVFFYFLKTLSNAKYKYVKIQRKIFLEDDLAMIFLLNLVCYVAYTAKYLTYLLKSTEVIQIWEFDNLHTTQTVQR